MKILVSFFLFLSFLSCQKETNEIAQINNQKKLSVRSALFNPVVFNHNNISFVHTETVPSGQIQAIKFGAYSKNKSLKSFLVNSTEVQRDVKDPGSFGLLINASDPKINLFKSNLNLSMDDEACEFEPISVSFNSLPTQISVGSVISWTTSQNYTGQKVLVIANLSDLNAEIYDYQYKILDEDNYVIENAFLEKFNNGSTVFFTVGIAEMVENDDNLFINCHTNYSFERKVIK